MSLIDELQESAEQDDALTVLRKAKRLSSKLKKQEIMHWVDAELSGYKPSADMPAYRISPTTMHYNTNGFIPAGFGRIMNGIQPLPGGIERLEVPIRDPIATILDWTKNKDKKAGLYFPVPEESAEVLRSQLSCNFPQVIDQLTFLAKLSDAVVRAIPDHVKNRVLNWALELESAGITGEGKSFTKKEQAIARDITFNINGSNIDQLNNLGNNQKDRYD